MWKTCQVKCGVSAAFRWTEGHACRCAWPAERCRWKLPAEEAGWVFLLAWQGCFCHWAGCGVESLMVLSFACPAARYSAKEARGRPRMALTGRRGEAAVDACCLRRSPPKGWGRNQRIYLACKNRRTDPKRTAHKKGEVIRKFGPWMDFWVLKGIRKIPVHKTWTKNVVDRDWFRVPAGTPGPDGLNQATWTYGKFLSQKLVKKLLDY